ncbi:MAG: T9SS type A sorting domain-containing protein [Saprospiraceae bacterium]|nr:T9SS type A sorting domain-containing protein [Saprospiraceae bacterium]
MKYILSIILTLTLPLMSFSQVTESDSLALVDFFNALGGDNWYNKTRWLKGSVSEWRGIRVDSGRVSSITLSSNNLIGSLPESLNDLDKLEFIFLARNEITGTLPKVDSLVNLKVLDLSVNPLDTTFPESIRGLINLTELNLAETGLTDTLPEWLPELTNLISFNISSNNLTGEYYSQLSQLTKLELIDIFGNEFSGPIRDFSVIPRLRDLSLGGNDFTGPFPEWITELQFLRYLHIGGCDLSGPVPDSLFSKVNRNMIELVLSNNDFYGDLQNIMDAPLIRLNRLELARNNFSGYIPEGIIDPKVMFKWSIGYNNIEGIPDFSMADQTVNWFYCNDNKLGFEYLETCLNIKEPQPNRIALGPQQPLLEEEHLRPAMGERLELQSGSGGANSQYQWYKDSMPIPGANQSEYVINDFKPGDEGIYHCVISNNLFEFDLVRNPVWIENTVSTRDDDMKKPIKIFPNPFRSTFEIQLNDQLTLDQVQIELMKESGQIIRVFKPSSHEFIVDINDQPDGVYIIIVKLNGSILFKKVMKQK